MNLTFLQPAVTKSLQQQTVCRLQLVALLLLLLMQLLLLLSLSLPMSMPDRQPQLTLGPPAAAAVSPISAVLLPLTLQNKSGHYPGHLAAAAHHVCSYGAALCAAAIAAAAACAAAADVHACWVMKAHFPRAQRGRGAPQRVMISFLNT